MSASSIHNTNTTSQAGFPPAPSEALQRANVLIARITTPQGEAFAAELLENPGKGDFLRKVGPVYMVQEQGGYTHSISDKWVKEHHGMAGAILTAIDDIESGNNGYADIGNSKEVAEAVEAAGFVVILTRNLHGVAVYRGFTKRAQAALRLSEHGVCTVTRSNPAPHTDADVEAMILARDASKIHF